MVLVNESQQHVPKFPYSLSHRRTATSSGGRPGSSIYSFIERAANLYAPAESCLNPTLEPYSQPRTAAHTPQRPAHDRSRHLHDLRCVIVPQLNLTYRFGWGNADSSQHLPHVPRRQRKPVTPSPAYAATPSRTRSNSASAEVTFTKWKPTTRSEHEEHMHMLFHDSMLTKGTTTR